MHTDAPDLGENQIAVIESCPVPLFLVGEGVVAVPALEGGEGRPLAPLEATEECLVGLVESREHILEDVEVDRGILWKLCADGLHHGLLLVAREGDVTP